MSFLSAPVVFIADLFYLKLSLTYHFFFKKSSKKLKNFKKFLYVMRDMGLGVWNL